MTDEFLDFNHMNHKCRFKKMKTVNYNIVVAPIFFHKSTFIPNTFSIQLNRRGRNLSNNNRSSNVQTPDMLD